MTPTLARRASLSLTILIAVGFGLWLRFLRAPSPEVLCDYVVGITVAEARSHGLASETQSNLADHLTEHCITLKRDKLQLRGRIVYAKHARCVMAATTTAELERC